MKISKRQLKRIIKEEKSKLLRESVTDMSHYDDAADRAAMDMSDLFYKDMMTLYDEEPDAFSFSGNTQVVSDNFSFLSQTPDEMAAKGDGGTKQMYFYSGIEEGGSIETPPEDYIPNKIGDNDYQKFQEQRMREIPDIPKVNKTY